MTKRSESYFVSEWLVEPSLLRISRKGDVRKLEPQVMAVLQLLASNPGGVVTKNDLKQIAM